EQRMDLEAGTAAEGVFDGEPPGGDVAGAADLQRRPGDLASGLPGPQPRQQAEVPIAEVRASIRDTELPLELAIGIEEAIRIDQEIGLRFAVHRREHRQLEVIVLEAVEQLEPESDRL